MDYFSYLANDINPSATVVMDSTVAEMKSRNADIFPKRIKLARNLIDFIPRARALEILNEGTALIRTISEEEKHQRIAKYLMDVFYGLKTREDLIRYLMRLGELDEEQAELIAHDQVNKAAERFCVEKWKRQGCKKVKWVHEGATEPRRYHLRKWNGVSGKRTGRPNGLNGYIFDIDKPPVINQKTKERGYPGQMINCHCRLVPIWE